MNPFDCKIYCNSIISVNELRGKIASFLSTNKIMVSFIDTDFYELSVYINDEFDIEKSVKYPDGFLYFKFIIEIGFKKDCALNICVQETSRILKWLWKHGMSAVKFASFTSFS